MVVFPMQHTRDDDVPPRLAMDRRKLEPDASRNFLKLKEREAIGGGANAEEGTLAIVCHPDNSRGNAVDGKDATFVGIIIHLEDASMFFAGAPPEIGQRAVRDKVS